MLVLFVFCTGLGCGFVSCGTGSTPPTEGGNNADGGTVTEGSSTRQWNQADLSCKPPNNTTPMPKSAREYAKMCEQHGLGVPPQVSCDEGVQVPIVVNGQEVFETPKSCEITSMLKPSCEVGSKIGRVQGKDANGKALPNVIWIYFCRATEATKASSVQMIAYHKTTGATCFFEANEGSNSILREKLGRDDKNGLTTGKLPAYTDPNFDRAFVPAPGQCVQCHQNNPFIRNPWLDGARMPNNPDEFVLPSLGAKSPYYVVGGANWDMRTIHIEGNQCLSCHRVGMEIDQLFARNGFDVNTYMPPHAPGSMKEDYDQLLKCWQDGPENTPGCDWIIPPAGDCKGGVVGDNYPYKSSFFNKGSSKGNGKDDGCYESCLKKGASEAVCKDACKSGGKDDPKACYDACKKKGGSDDDCTKTCNPSGGGKNAKECYDGCIKAGKSKDDCSKGCNYTP